MFIILKTCSTYYSLMVISLPARRVENMFFRNRLNSESVKCRHFACGRLEGRLWGSFGSIVNAYKPTKAMATSSVIGREITALVSSPNWPSFVMLVLYELQVLFAKEPLDRFASKGYR